MSVERRSCRGRARYEEACVHVCTFRCCSVVGVVSAVGVADVVGVLSVASLVGVVGIPCRAPSPPASYHRTRSARHRLGTAAASPG
eukprot:scaffold44541_cov42-Phaeocystis_antarctica.AAC.2